jgi:hypothetical protein
MRATPWHGHCSAAHRPRFAERKESFVAVQTLPCSPRSSPRGRNAATDPCVDRGIQHLLSDVEKRVLNAAGGQCLTQLAHAAPNERIEDLLLQAIMQLHPNRGRAIDRLLGDVVGDAAIDDGGPIMHHAAGETSFDNDFDGMA